MKPLLPWRILFAVIAAYHVVLGLVLIVSGDLSIEAARMLYGWTIEGSPTLGIAGEILGCYFIAFGLAMAAAAHDPVRNRACVTVGIVLFVLRLFQRLYFAGKVMEVFEVPSGRYWGAFAFVLLMAVLVGAGRWAIHRVAPSEAAAA